MKKQLILIMATALATISLDGEERFDKQVRGDFFAGFCREQRGYGLRDGEGGSYPCRRPETRRSPRLVRCWTPRPIGPTLPVG